MALISLCMIVRNEEAEISRCLASAKEAVDEMIVVDTGSQDNTIDLARSQGAKVFEIPWQDDFAAARNQALEKATGRWILTLDADEYLAPEAPALLRAAAERDDSSGFMLPVVNLLEEDKQTTCMMMRFFVNRPEIRYRYLIHEQVLPDLIHYAQRASKPISHLQAKIFHTGYRRECLLSRQKIERNEALFWKQLAFYPRDLYSWFKYAEFQLFAGTPPEKVYATLEEAYRLLTALPDPNVRTLPFAGEIVAYLAMVLFEEMGEIEKSHRIVEESVKRCLPTPHLCFVKAGVERALGRYTEAIDSYRRCLDFAGKELMVPVTDGVMSWLALAGIGLCHLSTGDFEQAQACFFESIKQRPDQIDPYSGLAEIAFQRGDAHGALEWMKKLLEFRPDCQPAWTTGALILTHLGLEEEASKWRARAGDTSAEKTGSTSLTSLI